MPFPDEPSDAVVLVYQPSWPDDFGRVAAQLADALGPLAVGIDHIGSTSVPGLAAKDCIDVQVRVASLDTDAIVAAFDAIGFRLRPEPWNHGEPVHGVEHPKLVFAPPVAARRANVHVRVDGSPNAAYALLFRDFLRSDERARTAWGAFKLAIAEHVGDLGAYGRIKAPAWEVLMDAAERWAATGATRGA